MPVPPGLPREYHWTIDSRRAILMTLASLLLLSVGCLLFFGIASVMRPLGSDIHYLSSLFTNSPPTARADTVILTTLLSSLPLTFVLLLLHEWCHGLAYQWAGVKPQYGAKFVQKFFPVLYATAPGKWLTKRQYLIVGLAPTVLINVVGILLMWPPTMLRCLLILPLAMHLGGCIGDWWAAAFILRLPDSMEFEDDKEGFRYRFTR